jgi:hypothetical protein
MLISYISSLIFLNLNLHFLTEILLKVALNTINQTNKQNEQLPLTFTHKKDNDIWRCKFRSSFGTGTNMCRD